MTATRANQWARFPLATLPTALVPARRLQAAVGGPLVWVKRDDLAGFATAGNKARALEFLVGDALARDCDTLVTGGGASSNFCAATAAAARVAGLGCHLVLYGAPPLSHPNLAAALAAGAEVHCTGDSERDEVDHAIAKLAESLAAEGRHPYPIPRGGATPLGAMGYVEALGELLPQLALHGVEPGAVVLATGSGATQAGLVAANSLCPGTPAHLPRWRIIGATVSRPPSEIRATVAELAGACGRLLGLPPAGAADVEVVDARGPGFGVVAAEGERAARVAFDTEGLMLDPVYTAKAFTLVLGLIAGGFGRPIVFWHTGGLPAAIHHLASERSTCAQLPPDVRARAADRETGGGTGRVRFRARER